MQTILIIVGGVIVSSVILYSIVASANSKVIAENQKNNEANLDAIDMNHRYTTNSLTQLQNKNDAMIQAIKNLEDALKTVTPEDNKV